MAERLLKLDDVRHIDTPQNIALLFQKIGYNASAQQLPKDELELSDRSAEAVWDSYLIADHHKGAESLQVLLFQLNPIEWSSPSVASNRMRSLAQSLCKRPSNFLLLGTRDYNQLMLVNPRKSFDADMNLKVNIRKLLIDRTNPTPYDRDRLEAIAARNLFPQKLYDTQCDAFDVEKLTKDFYQDYRKIFKEVQQVIKDNNPHPYFDDSSRLHQFSQRLLGRVMFLYFLQKKEFLGSDRDFLRNEYRNLKPEAEDADFYETLLEPLFFDTLNKQRPNNESPWGKIPYLNGGLFEKDYGDKVFDAAGVATPSKIHLPNSLFDPSAEKGVLKFFNSYNFTVAENLQGDEEEAVDPEMLGKVFENLLVAEE
nr:type II restriction endonuclease [Nostocaceae cyanobacterium]